MLFRSVVFIAVFISFAYLSNAQCKVWFNCETLWSKVISEFPNDPEGYQNRGLYLADKSRYDVNPSQNDYDNAFKDFKFSFTISQNEPKIYSNVGNIYGIRGKYDSALINYSKAIELDSTDFNTYMNRAVTYSMMQNYDSAFVDWDKVIKLHGPDNRVYQNRALAYLNRGRFKESIHDYKSLTDMGVQMDGNMYFFRGCDYFQLGNYDAAIEDYTKALAINPNNKDAYFNRSQTYHKMNKPNEALDDALHAQRLGYQVDPAYIEQLKKH